MLRFTSSICKLINENLKNVYASCAITTQKSKSLSLETHTFGTRWAHHTMPPVSTPSSFCLAMIWFDDILSPGSQKRARHQRTCKWIRLFYNFIVSSLSSTWRDFDAWCFVKRVLKLSSVSLKKQQHT